MSNDTEPIPLVRRGPKEVRAYQLLALGYAVVQDQVIPIY